MSNRRLRITKLVQMLVTTTIIFIQLISPVAALASDASASQEQAATSFNDPAVLASLPRAGLAKIVPDVQVEVPAARAGGLDASVPETPGVATSQDDGPAAAPAAAPRASFPPSGSRYAYASFDSGDGFTLGDLNGSAAGSGWNGTWAAASGDESVVAAALGYAVLGGGTVNGGDQALQVSGTQDPLISRQLSASRNEDEVFISFLLQFNSGTISNNDFVALWFGSSTGPNIGMKANQGDGSGPLDFFSRLSSTDTEAYSTDMGAAVPSATYFVVGRLWKSTPGAGNNYDRYDLWISPAYGDSGTPDVTASGDAGFSSFQDFGIRTANLGTDAVLVDEINIGDEWDDVVPPDNVGGLSDLAVSKYGEGEIYDWGMDDFYTTPFAATAGRFVTYTLVVDNYGPATANDIVLEDTLPEGFTMWFIDISPDQGECTLIDRELNCALGDLDAYETIVVTVFGLVDYDYAIKYPLIPAAQLVNNATVSSSNPDPDLSNNQAMQRVIVTFLADLTIEKINVTQLVTDVVAGELLEYTIAVANTGPSLARDVTLIEPLPPELEFVSMSFLDHPEVECIYSETTHGVGCHLGDLEPLWGDAALVQVRVDPTVPSGTTIVNDAYVVTVTPEKYYDNNYDEAYAYVYAKADLEITKTASDLTPVAAGEQLIYEINVVNHGPSIARNVEVTDTLPLGVSYLLNTYGSDCVPSLASGPGGEDQLICDLGAMAVDEVKSFEVVVLVNADTPDDTQLDNLAVVTTSDIDPIITNNSDIAEVSTDTVSDLAIVKISKPDTKVEAGVPFSYTIFIDNYGPSYATGLVMTDTVLSVGDFTVESVTDDRGGTCGYSGGVVVCTLASLEPVGIGEGTGRWMIEVIISADEAQDVNNEVIVRSEVFDPDLSNNQAIDFISVDALANLQVTKEADLATVLAGMTAYYTVTVYNDGPSVAENVVLRDLMPADLVEGTIWVSDPGCTIGTPGDPADPMVCALGDLDVADTITIYINADVDASVLAGLSGDPLFAYLDNDVFVESDTIDPDISDNSATAATYVEDQADLEVYKEGPVSLFAGESGSFTIEVYNWGPSTAREVLLRDQVDPGMRIDSAVVVDVLDSQCSIFTSVAPDDTLLCDLGDLEPDDNVARFINVNVSVDPDVTSAALTNTVEVVSGDFLTELTLDPGPGTNVYSVPVLIGVQDNLAITKEALDLTPMAGSELTYQITVVNNGPSVATNVTVNDALDADLTYLSNSDSCIESPIGTLTCSLGDLTVGGSASFDLVVELAETAIGPITNTAYAWSNTFGPISATVTVNVGGLSDLAINKDAEGERYSIFLDDFVPSSLIATAGRFVTYDLVVDNYGPGLATDVVLQDTLPEGFTMWSINISPDQGECTLIDRDLNCALGDLDADETIIVEVYGRVVYDYALKYPLVPLAQLINNATVSSSSPDPDLSNNQMMRRLLVDFIADLTIEKINVTQLVTDVVAGELLEYTIAVGNTGPSLARDVTLIEPLPPELEFVSMSFIDHPEVECIYSETTHGVGCHLGDLEPLWGDAALLQVRVDPTVPTGSIIINDAYVVTVTPETYNDNNYDEAYAYVYANADLEITKTASDLTPVAAGEQLIYEISVVNHGPSIARNVEVTDTLPLDVSYLLNTYGADCVPSPASGPGGEDQLICDLGTMAVDEVKSFEVVVLVNADAPDNTQLDNLVIVSTSDIDPLLTNNSDIAEVNTDTEADLRVLKFGKPDGHVDAGDFLTYTVIVENIGPSYAHNVQLLDELTSDGTFTVVDINPDVLGDRSAATCVPIQSAITNLTLLQSSDDNPAWTSVAGDATVGFFMQLAPLTGTYYYLDVASLTTNEPLVDGYHPFTLDPSSVPSGFYAYWAAKGVDASAGAGTWQEHMYQIITGNAPMLYLLQSGSSYDLIDGLQRDYPGIGIDAPFRINDDYHLGTYDLNGVLSEADGGSSTLPIQMTFTSTPPVVPSAGFTPITASERLTIACLLGADLEVVGPTPNQGRWMIEIVVTADETQDINNVATVSGTDLDPNPDNNTAYVEHDIIDISDLAITKEVGGELWTPVGIIPNLPYYVTAGQNLTYTLTITNYGPSTAYNVFVHDDLPPGLTMLDATASNGGVCNFTSTDVDCGLDTLAVDEVVTITIRATVHDDVPDGTFLDNNAWVSGANYDTFNNNNFAHAQIEVDASSQLYYEKEDSPDPVVAGEVLEYRIYVRNDGPSLARAVRFSDDLPTEALLTLSEYVINNAEGYCTYNQSEHDIDCYLGDLPVGAGYGVEVFLRLVVDPAAVPPGDPDGMVLLDNDITVRSTSYYYIDYSAVDGEEETTVVANADLEIIKDVSTLTPVAGRDLTYEITVINNGPSVAPNVTVTDTLPAGMTYRMDTDTCTLLEGAGPGGEDLLVCDLGHIPESESRSFEVVVRVDADVSENTELYNLVETTSDVTDTLTINNTDIAEVEIDTEADLRIQKYGKPDGEVQADEVLTYTLIVDNLGPSYAHTVTVTDTLLSDGVFTLLDVTSDRDAYCAPTSGDFSNEAEIVCILNDPLEPVGILEGSGRWEIVMTIVASETQSINNTAFVASSDLEPDWSNNVATAKHQITAVADLQISKDVAGQIWTPSGTLQNVPTMVTAGYNLTYTLTIVNSGPSTAENVFVHDDLPPGLTVLSVDVNGAGDDGCNYTDTMVECGLDTMGSGDTAVVTIVAQVHDDVPMFTILDNNAWVLSDNFDDDNTNDYANAQIEVRTASELYYEKNDEPDPVTAGEVLEYRILVWNDGPSLARNVRFFDDLPDGLTAFLGYEIANADDGYCFYHQTDHDVDCYLGDIEVSAENAVEVFLRFAVDPAFAEADPPYDNPMLNEIIVIADQYYYIDPEGVDGDEETTVEFDADLEVIKKAFNLTPVAGQEFSYKITVINHGPSIAEGVTVTDTFPADVTYLNDDFVCGEAALTTGCLLGDMESGDEISFIVRVQVNEDATPGTLLSNLVVVGSDTPDGNPDNNSDISDVYVNSVADLGIIKYGKPDGIVDAGELLTYTIIVENFGPSHAHNVQVLDELTSDGTFTVVDINPDVLGDRSAATCVPIQSAITNLTLVQSSDDNPTPWTPVAGDATVGFFMQLTPLASPPPAYYYLDVAGLITNEPLADGYHPFTLDPSSVPSGFYAYWAAKGVDASAGAGTWEEHMYQIITGNAPMLYLLQSGASYDLIDGLYHDFFGSDITFRINDDYPLGTYNLNGVLSEADGGSSTLPLQMTFTSTPPVVPSAGFTPITASERLTIACLLGADLEVVGPTPNQGRWMIEIVVMADETQDINNVATVSSNDLDWNISNNMAYVEHDVRDISDMSITKDVAGQIWTPVGIIEDVPTLVTAGLDLTYTLRVTNNGPSTAVNVMVEDEMPDGLTVHSVTASNAGVCTYTDTEFECGLDTMAVDEVVTITVQATVNDDVPDGTWLDNNAWVDNDNHDKNNANNYASAQIEVDAASELYVTKTDEPDPVIAGEVLEYRIYIRNQGPSLARGVHFYDDLPEYLSFIEFEIGHGSGECFYNMDSHDVDCYLGDLPVGAEYAVEVFMRFLVDPAAFMDLGSDPVVLDPDPTLENSVTVQADSWFYIDTNPEGGSDLDEETTVDWLADLDVTKTASDLTPVAGTDLTYEVTVSNNGPSVAPNVMLTDTLPAGVTYRFDTFECGATALATGCDLGTLGVGQSISFQIVVRVDADVQPGTQLNNLVVVASDVADPNLENNSDVAEVEVDTEADLRVLKFGKPDGHVDAGEFLTYTVIVENFGPSYAHQVQLLDELTSDRTFQVVSIDADVLGNRSTAVCMPVQSAVTTLSLIQSSDDNPTWTAVAGDPVVGFFMQLTPLTGDYYYLDVGSLITNEPLLDGYHPFTLDPSTVPAGFYAYWDAKGVNASASGWQGHMWQIITGNAPMLYLLQSGTSYDLIDGLQRDYAPIGIDAPFRINDDYYLGTYDLNGDLSEANGGSSTLPIQMTFTATAPVVPSGFTPITASERLTIACDLGADLEVVGPLPNQGRWMIEIVVTADETQDINNVATVSSIDLDPDLDNNTGYVEHDIIDISDMAISKEAVGQVWMGFDYVTMPDMATAGTYLTYTLTITNYGPSTAENVYVYDDLPAGLTVESVTPSQGVCSFTDTEFECGLDTMAPDSLVTITVVALVNADVPSGTLLDNNAWVTSDNFDRNNGNNFAWQQTEVFTLADISIEKIDITSLVTDVVAGTLLEYRIFIGNTGPSLARNVIIIDGLPQEVTYVDISFLDHPETVCQYNEATHILTCFLGDLEPNWADTALLKVWVDADVEHMTLITNTVGIISPTPDPDYGNNVDDEETMVYADADLEVIKSASDLTPVAGTELIYEITVINHGPSTAYNVIVTDTLPAGVTYRLDTLGCGEAALAAGCDLIGDLAVGESVSFEIVVLVDADVPPGTQLDNLVVVGSDTPDSIPENNGDIAEVNIDTEADLRVLKFGKPDGQVYAGDFLTYTVIVENFGPSYAHGVQLLDELTSDGTFELVSINPDVLGNRSTAVCIPIESAVTTLSLEQWNDDDATIIPVFGNSVVGFYMQLSDLTGDYYYLDVASLTTNEPLADGYHPFTLDPSSVPSGFYAYWDAKGVNASASGWQAHMYQIITGNAPILYLLQSGASYDLIDGLYRDFFSTDIAFRVNDDYPLGTYNLDGVLSEADGGTSNMPIEMTFTSAIATLTLEQWNDDDPTRVPVDGNSLIGFYMQLAPLAGDYYYLDVASLTTNEPLLDGYHPFTMDPSSVPAGFYAYWDAKGVNASAGVGTWQEHMYQIITGNAPILYLYQSGTSYDLIDGLYRDFFGNSTEPFKVNDDYPFGTYHLDGVLSEADGGSSTLPIEMTFSSDEPVVPDPIEPFTASERLTIACALGADLEVLGPTPNQGRWMIEIVVMAEETQDINNVAVASSIDLDPNPENNTGYVEHDIIDVSDMEIVKEAVGEVWTEMGLMMVDNYVTAGQTLTYTLTVTNNGPSTAENVFVHDDLPSGLTIQSVTPSQGTCNFTNTDIDCGLDTMAPDDVATIIVVALVSADVPYGTLLDNNTWVTSQNFDRNNGNNYANNQTYVYAVSELVVTKDDEPDPVTAGEVLEYRIHIWNRGPSVARGVRFFDDLPEGLTFLDYDIGNGNAVCFYNMAGHDVDCYLGDIEPGAMNGREVFLRFGVDPGLPHLSVLDNEVLVTAEIPLVFDPTSVFTETTTVEANADLAVTKMASDLTPVAGEQVSYEVTVVNNGPSTAFNVVITDTFPAGVTYLVDDFGCGEAALTTGCPLGDLDVGESVSFIIQVLIEPDVQPGTQLDNLVVVASDVPDLYDDNNSDIGEVYIDTVADLSIIKFGKPDGQVYAGELLTYTVIVENFGPSYAHSVTVLDELTANGEFELVSIDADALGNRGTAVCDPDTFPVGASERLTIACDLGADLEVVGPEPNQGRWMIEIVVRANQTQDINNVATVSSIDLDPDPSNNTAFVMHEVLDSADLGIIKTDDPDPVTAGQTLTYTLLVTNYGPSTAEDVVVTDELPDGLTVYPVTPSQGSCTYDNHFIECGLGDIEPGESATIIIVATVNENVPDGTLLHNNAWVVSGIHDPNNDNNYAHETTYVGMASGLYVSKDDSVDPVLAGEELEYAIYVRNDGPSMVENLFFYDTLPAGDYLDFEGYQIGNGSGNCFYQATNDRVDCYLGDLDVDEFRWVYLTFTVDPDTPDGTVLTNTVEWFANTPIDPTGDFDEETTVAAPSVDLKTYKTVTPDPAVAGELLTYRVTVENNGLATAPYVVLVDTLPVEVDYIVDTAGCTFSAATGPAGEDQLTCDLGDLVSGASTSFEIRVRVQADAVANGSLILTNLLFVDSEGVEANWVDNEFKLVTLLEEYADLSIIKMSKPDDHVYAGELFTYTLYVENTGPSYARLVSIRDEILSDGEFELVEVILDPDRNDAGPFFEGAVEGKQTLRFDLLEPLEPADIYNDGRWEIQIVVRANEEQDINNTALVFTQEEGTPDPDLSNNKALDPISVEASTDLEVTKEAPETVVAGEGITFTITVINHGPSRAENVTLMDVIPDGLADGTLHVSYAGCTTGTPGNENDPMVCQLGDMEAGDSVEIVITAVVDPGYLWAQESDQIQNDVAITSDTFDPETSQNRATTVTTVLAVADLMVTKTLEKITLPGGTIAFFITVTNLGPSDAMYATINDIAPDGIVDLMWTCKAYGGAICTATGTGDIDDVISLPVGSKLVYTVKGTVTVFQPITNMVTVIPPDNITDPDMDNNMDYVVNEPYLIFLPFIGRLLERPFPPELPDLVVESLVPKEHNVFVVIKNTGLAPVIDPFWVDVYIDPEKAPTKPNQTWDVQGHKGLVWGIFGDALPLEPGETLELRIGDEYFWPSFSLMALPLEIGTPVYAQVDSYNVPTDYGSVYETHEHINGMYNNIVGPITSSRSAPGVTPPDFGEDPFGAELPAR